jgi:hypothetical protein
MTGRNAEGRTCEICRRRLLAGETFAFLDHVAERKHRRPVCTLCQRQARERGWTRTVELPPPVVFPSLTEPDAGDPDSRTQTQVSPPSPNRTDG